MAIIETGNYCNIRCPTCTTPHNKIHRKKELMSFDNFKKVIDNIKDSVHVILVYNSNEPLLHPDICRMINYAHKNNLYTLISTNVTLLDEKMAKALFVSGLDEILLCLDGVTKESYEPFRLGANFETVMKNIKHFCQQKQNLGLRKPFIELQFILNKFNQNEVKDIKKLAKELKVDRLHVKSFALGEYAYSEKEIKELSKKFYPDTEEYRQKVIYSRKQNGLLKAKKFPLKCSLVRSQFVVLVDGRISMCCYDLNGKYIYGSALNKRAKDVWFSPKAKSVRKLAKNRKYPLCQVCSIF
ncbi:MAG: radical SAM/SPASM domain-containing protein [Candidatus Nealsonbacteria bacterium]